MGGGGGGGRDNPVLVPHFCGKHLVPYLKLTFLEVSSSTFSYIKYKSRLSNLQGKFEIWKRVLPTFLSGADATQQVELLAQP